MANPKEAGQKRKRIDSKGKNSNEPPKKKAKGEDETKVLLKALNTSLQEFHKKKGQLKKYLNEKKNKDEGYKKIKNECDTILKAISDKLTGKLLRFSRRRSGSVLIQTLLKQKDEKIQRSIYEELKSHIMELSSNVYGVHVLLSLLKTNTEFRQEIVNFISVHGPAMLILQESIRVVDEVFINGKGAERRLILRGFYGSDRHDSSTIDKLTNESFDKLSLTKYCQENPDKAPIVVKRLIEVISKAISKELLGPFQILHYLTNEAVNIATPEKTRFLVSDILEQLVHIVHTPYGRDLAIKSIYYGRSKERKVILNEFKKFIIEGSKNANASLVLCAIADVTDDTKKVFQNIYKQMFNNLGELIKDQHASRVLIFPFAPCEKRYFSMDQISCIRPQNIRTDIFPKDSADYAVHRKTKETIHSQLCEQLYIPLLTEVKAAVSEFVSSGYGADLIAELFRYEGDASQSKEAKDLKEAIASEIFDYITTNNDALISLKVQKLIGRILKSYQPLKKKFYKFIKSSPSKDIKKLIISHNFSHVVVPVLKEEKYYKKLKPILSTFIKDVKKVAEENQKDFGYNLLLKTFEEPIFVTAIN